MLNGNGYLANVRDARILNLVNRYEQTVPLPGALTRHAFQRLFF
ncbi:hypothetical protein [Enorma phocaeensis]|nr:hypothetical protein [Enorma phocaeensis]